MSSDGVSNLPCTVVFSTSQDQKKKSFTASCRIHEKHGEFMVTCLLEAKIMTNTVTEELQ